MKPNFKSGVLFGENVMGCEIGKIKVVMNKLVYLDQVILDLSKIVMYEFHYDYMIPKIGDRLKLCYMDMDSLVYHIKTEDFYADIVDDVQTKFDTSGYIPDRPSSSRTKQKGHWTHERRIRRQDNDRIRGIETKALFL